jgi:hypothetical protein
MADLYGGENEDAELRERRLMLEQMGQEPGVAMQDRVPLEGAQSGSRRTEGMRSMDFQDANQNGIDDRDEPSDTPDRSAWNTKGYSVPQYTATDFGNAPSGWDQTKWADPNAQQPKYVVGRILMAGDRSTPEGRAEIIANIQKAYPGTTYSGKDKVSIPGVGQNIDIFQGASAGLWGPAWQPPEEGGSARPPGYYGPNSAGMANAVGSSLVPDDWDAYKQMQARLQELLGGGGTFDREALLRQMMR